MYWLKCSHCCSLLYDVYPTPHTIWCITQMSNLFLGGQRFIFLKMFIQMYAMMMRRRMTVTKNLIEMLPIFSGEDSKRSLHWDCEIASAVLLSAAIAGLLWKTVGLEGFSFSFFTRLLNVQEFLCSEWVKEVLFLYKHYSITQIKITDKIACLQL